MRQKPPFQCYIDILIIERKTGKKSNFIVGESTTAIWPQYKDKRSQINFKYIYIYILFFGLIPKLREQKWLFFQIYAYIFGLIAGSEQKKQCQKGGVF